MKTKKIKKKDVTKEQVDWGGVHYQGKEKLISKNVRFESKSNMDEADEIMKKLRIYFTPIEENYMIGHLYESILKNEASTVERKPSDTVAPYGEKLDDKCIEWLLSGYLLNNEQYVDELYKLGVTLKENLKKDHVSYTLFGTNKKALTKGPKKITHTGNDWLIEDYDELNMATVTDNMATVTDNNRINGTYIQLIKIIRDLLFIECVERNEEDKKKRQTKENHISVNAVKYINFLMFVGIYPRKYSVEEMKAITSKNVLDNSAFVNLHNNLYKKFRFEILSAAGEGKNNICAWRKKEKKCIKNTGCSWDDTKEPKCDKNEKLIHNINQPQTLGDFINNYQRRKKSMFKRRGQDGKSKIIRNKIHNIWNSQLYKKEIFNLVKKHTLTTKYCEFLSTDMHKNVSTVIMALLKNKTCLGLPQCKYSKKSKRRAKCTGRSSMFRSKKDINGSGKKKERARAITILNSIIVYDKNYVPSTPTASSSKRDYKKYLLDVAKCNLSLDENVIKHCAIINSHRISYIYWLFIYDIVRGRTIPSSDEHPTIQNFFENSSSIPDIFKIPTSIKTMDIKWLDKILLPSPISNFFANAGVEVKLNIGDGNAFWKDVVGIFNSDNIEHNFIKDILPKLNYVFIIFIVDQVIGTNNTQHGGDNTLAFRRGSNAEEDISGVISKEAKTQSKTQSSVINATQINNYRFDIKNITGFNKTTQKTQLIKDIYFGLFLVIKNLPTNVDIEECEVNDIKQNINKRQDNDEKLKSIEATLNIISGGSRLEKEPINAIVTTVEEDEEENGGEEEGRKGKKYLSFKNNTEYYHIPFEQINGKINLEDSYFISTNRNKFPKSHNPSADNLDDLLNTIGKIFDIKLHLFDTKSIDNTVFLKQLKKYKSRQNNSSSTKLNDYENGLFEKIAKLHTAFSNS